MNIPSHDSSSLPYLKQEKDLKVNSKNFPFIFREELLKLFESDAC